MAVLRAAIHYGPTPRHAAGVVSHLSPFLTFSRLCKNYGRWAHRITPLRGAVSDAPGTALIRLGGGETNKLLHDAPTSKPRPNETVPVVTLEMVWAAFNRPSVRQVKVQIYS